MDTLFMDGRKDHDSNDLLAPTISKLQPKILDSSHPFSPNKTLSTNALGVHKNPTLRVKGIERPYKVIDRPILSTSQRTLKLKLMQSPSPTTYDDEYFVPISREEQSRTLNKKRMDIQKYKFGVMNHNKVEILQKQMPSTEFKPQKALRGSSKGVNATIQHHETVNNHVDRKKMSVKAMSAKDTLDKRDMIRFAKGVNGEVESDASKTSPLYTEALYRNTRTYRPWQSFQEGVGQHDSYDDVRKEEFYEGAFLYEENAPKILESEGGVKIEIPLDKPDPPIPVCIPAQVSVPGQPVVTAIDGGYSLPHSKTRTKSRSRVRTQAPRKIVCPPNPMVKLDQGEIYDSHESTDEFPSPIRSPMTQSGRSPMNKDTLRPSTSYEPFTSSANSRPTTPIYTQRANTAPTGKGPGGLGDDMETFRTDTVDLAPNQGLRLLKIGSKMDKSSHICSKCVRQTGRLWCPQCAAMYCGTCWVGVAHHVLPEMLSPNLIAAMTKAEEEEQAQELNGLASGTEEEEPFPKPKEVPWSVHGTNRMKANIPQSLEQRMKTDWNSYPLPPVFLDGKGKVYHFEHIDNVRPAMTKPLAEVNMTLRNSRQGMSTTAHHLVFVDVDAFEPEVEGGDEGMMAPLEGVEDLDDPIGFYNNRGRVSPPHSPSSPYHGGGGSHSPPDSPWYTTKEDIRQHLPVPMSRFSHAVLMRKKGYLPPKVLQTGGSPPPSRPTTAGGEGMGDDEMPGFKGLGGTGGSSASPFKKKDFIPLTPMSRMSPLETYNHTNKLSRPSTASSSMLSPTGRPMSQSNPRDKVYRERQQRAFGISQTSECSSPVVFARRPNTSPTDAAAQLKIGQMCEFTLPKPVPERGREREEKLRDEKYEANQAMEEQETRKTEILNGVVVHTIRVDGAQESIALSALSTQTPTPGVGPGAGEGAGPGMARKGKGRGGDAALKVAAGGAGTEVGVQRVSIPHGSLKGGARFDDELSVETKP